MHYVPTISCFIQTNFFLVHFVNLEEGEGSPKIHFKQNMKLLADSNALKTVLFLFLYIIMLCFYYYYYIYIYIFFCLGEAYLLALGSKY